MAKAAGLFVLTLVFLFIFLGHASRAHPKEKVDSVDQDGGEEKMEVSCDGVGEDECLMRRTLVAHTDYIYTQEKPHA